MKKIQTIPLMLIIFVSLISTLSFFSCTGNYAAVSLSNTFNTSKIKTEHLVLDDENNSADQQFLCEAIINSMVSIHTARLAQEKSTNAQIVALGCLLENEQSVTVAELQHLARQRNLSFKFPSVHLIQEKTALLNDLYGIQFDREFSRQQVITQKMAIMLCEQNMRETSDIGINNWIEKILPSLRHTLESAELCLQSLG